MSTLDETPPIVERAYPVFLAAYILIVLGVLYLAFFREDGADQPDPADRQGTGTQLDPFDRSAWLYDGEDLQRALSESKYGFVARYTPLEILGYPAGIGVKSPEAERAATPAQVAAFESLLRDFDLDMERALLDTLFDAYKEMRKTDVGKNFPPYESADELAGQLITPAIVRIFPGERELAATSIRFYSKGDITIAFEAYVHGREIGSVVISEIYPIQAERN